MKTDAQQAIQQTAPTTKAAQLREVMPQIEKKLAAGVQLGTIHQALTDAGFELTFQTLKTYLYRYRKQRRAKSAGRQAEPVDSRTAAAPASPRPEASVPSATDAGPPRPREPLSVQEIDRLMKPDPAELAERIARYERIAIEKERK
ncbi:conjugal transfer protein TraD [Pandoraea sputorum]|uniref:conjugal transfer protein TraD n=1 Tax=Pandoraea sputorum TaxID=93222 RepID=UPI001240D32E|nr:conjugal transfer protein TraD [Pandoraea sputorum]VVE59122.1 conjugal transfer protein TraD [Pandoraea sputorum]